MRDASSARRWLRPELVAPWREVALVSLLFIGPLIWRSSVAAWSGSGSHFIEILMSDWRLLKTVAIEGAFLALFLVVLRSRGWTAADFNIGINLRGTLQGFGLFLTTEVVHLVALALLLVLVYALQTRYAHFLPFAQSQLPHVGRHSLTLSWPVIFAAMILNAYVEELICMGYFFTQIAAKQGPLAALLLTVLVRMAYHTYQGPLNALTIGAVFFVYGLWYWRTRNLWVLIFAHLTLDTVSTGLAKILFGR